MFIFRFVLERLDGLVDLSAAALHDECLSTQTPSLSSSISSSSSSAAADDTHCLSLRQSPVDTVRQWLLQIKTLGVLPDHVFCHGSHPRLVGTVTSRLPR
eukprot:GHVQ01003411.1.p2 GENE.GHVQ01003411.1~~GHVQ01003411.1.p2  ORF type:complete len:100 (-),score=24.45 GHVQ01003411.1:898-1197(-)